MRKPTKPRTTVKDIEAGKRLKTIREKRGFRRQEIANLLKVTYQQVQKYEIGQNRIPSSILHEISRILNVPMEYFFCEANEPHKARLAVKTIAGSGLSEFEYIEDSFNKQFDYHIYWTHKAIEADIKNNYDQCMAIAHYEEIVMVSTEHIIKLGNKTIKRLAKGVNDN
ncbi:MAG: helix-turn-helix transcriptional regulator [Cyclobacteriaceae bacterium]